MLGTLTGVGLLIVGIALMKFKGGFKKRKTLHWLTERFAALVFVAAGIAGFTGYLGDLVTRLTEFFVGLANSASAAIAGQSVFGLLVVILAVYWILSFLPKGVYDNDMSDWLIYAGILIPVLLGAATIPLAEPLSALFTALGGLGTQILGA